LVAGRNKTSIFCTEPQLTSFSLPLAEIIAGSEEPADLAQLPADAAADAWLIAQAKQF
jgi:hypothetical protein